MNQETDIRPVEPKGPEMIPTAQVNVPAPEKISVSANVPAIDDRVGIFSIVLLWIKENLINDILNSRVKGSAMDSKFWFASKTLWVNFLVMLWSFIGPAIGIPVVTPEITFVILVAINLVLRVVTKQPIALIDAFSSSDPSKAWYTSKTLWFNIVSVCWIIIGPLVGEPTLPPDVFTGVLALVNIVLRFITKAPVVFTE